MPTTRVFVTKDGKIVIEGVGYVGPRCVEDAEKLQEVLRTLGVEVKIEVQQKKPEYSVVAEAASHGQQA